jgi:hypothetical protein
VWPGTFLTLLNFKFLASEKVGNLIKTITTKLYIPCRTIIRAADVVRLSATG